MVAVDVHQIDARFWDSAGSALATLQPPAKSNGTERTIRASLARSSVVSE
jgi:hypothetical protein